MSSRDGLYRESALAAFEVLNAGRHLEELVQGEGNEDDVSDALVELNQRLLAYSPGIARNGTYDKDRLTFIRTARLFLDEQRFDGLRLLVDQFWGIFHPDQKRYCGRINKTCSTKGCLHKFVSVKQVICPECDAPRQMCRQPPTSTNGRCEENGHGGYTNTTKMIGKWNGIDATNAGRLSAYSAAMLPSLRGAYDQLVSDPDFLAMVGEIGLLGARNVILLQQMDEFDPLTVERELRTNLAQLKSSVESGLHPQRALGFINEMQHIMDIARDNSKRWSELKDNIGIMARLSDTERKRLVEAQHTITKAEVEMLLEVARTGIQTSINNSGRQILQTIMRLMESRVDASEFAAMEKLFEAISLGRIIEDTLSKHIANAVAAGRNVREVQNEAEIIIDGESS